MYLVVQGDWLALLKLEQSCLGGGGVGGLGCQWSFCAFRLGKLNATLEGALMHSFSLNVKNRKFKSVEKIDYSCSKSVRYKHKSLREGGALNAMSVQNNTDNNNMMALLQSRV
jgi:hypothetical protein